MDMTMYEIEQATPPFAEFPGCAFGEYERVQMQIESKPEFELRKQLRDLQAIGNLSPRSQMELRMLRSVLD